MSKGILGITGILIVISPFCFGQVSTFPNPPPLPPAVQSNTGTAQAPASAPSSTPGANEAPSPDAASPIPVTAATLGSMAALDDQVALEPGDRLSFRVIEDRDDAVPRTVTDSGEVDFPYVGRIKVEGQTCKQVAIQLKKLLEVDYYKRATVIVGLDVIAGHEEAAREMAWVVGQVRQVGPQQLSSVRPMTVSQIILRAGGFGDFADQRKVKVIHRASLLASPNAAEVPIENTEGHETQIVDVKAVFEGSSAVDPVVLPNDYIIVPKRLVNF